MLTPMPLDNAAARLPLSHPFPSRPAPRSLRRSRQEGATLIVSLLILIVLTLIGITSMSTSGLEEKMAGNSRDLNLAFQAAEAALKDAEEFINTGITSTTAFDGSTAGLYPPVTETNPPPDYFDSAVWISARNYSGIIEGVKAQPKYIIELVGTMRADNNDINIKPGYGDSSGIGELTTFRITARGTGGTNEATVILQTYYAKRI